MYEDELTYSPSDTLSVVRFNARTQRKIILICVGSAAVPIRQTVFNEYNKSKAGLHFKANIYLIIAINSCGPFKHWCMNILRNF